MESFIRIIVTLRTEVYETEMLLTLSIIQATRTAAAVSRGQSEDRD